MADHFCSTPTPPEAPGVAAATPSEDLRRAEERAHAGDAVAARAQLVAARQAWPGNRVILNQLLGLLQGDLPAALAEYERARRVPGPDLATFRALLGACRRAGDLRQALALWRDLLAARLEPTPELWQEFVAIAAAAGQPTEELGPEPTSASWALLHERVLGSPPPPPPPPRARKSPAPSRAEMTAQIWLLFARLQRHDAAALFAEMVQSGLRPSAEIWARLLHALGFAGESRAIAALIAHARAHGLGAPETAWLALLDGLVQAGQPGSAAALLDLACRQGAKPGREILACYVQACVEADPPDLAAAFRLARRLRAQGYRANSRFCSLLMKGLHRAGRHDEACALYRDLRAAGMNPTVQTMATAVRSLLALGRQEEAVRLFGEHCSLWIPERLLYLDLIGELRRTGSYELAVRVKLHYRDARAALEPADDEEEARAAAAEPAPPASAREDGR